MLKAFQKEKDRERYGGRRGSFIHFTDFFKVCVFSLVSDTVGQSTCRHELGFGMDMLDIRTARKRDVFFEVTVRG